MRSAILRGSTLANRTHLTTGHQTDADVRVEERRLVRGDGDVAGGDPVQPCAEHNPLIAVSTGLAILRNRRGALLRGLPLVVGGQVRPLVDHPAVLRDLTDVGAGAERAAGAGDDEDPMLSSFSASSYAERIR